MDKHKQREYESELRKKINEDRLRELEDQNYMEFEEKRMRGQRQQIYKNILDDQVSPNTRSPIVKKSFENLLQPNPCIYS